MHFSRPHVSGSAISFYRAVNFEWFLVELEKLLTLSVLTWASLDAQIVAPFAAPNVEIATQKMIKTAKPFLESKNFSFSHDFWRFSTLPWLYVAPKETPTAPELTNFVGLSTVRYEIFVRTYNTVTSGMLVSKTRGKVFSGVVNSSAIKFSEFQPS